MSIKQVTVSDVSGKDIPDGEHVTAVVKHPDVQFPVEIDLSQAEADKLQDTTLRMVEFELRGTGGRRTVRVETKVLDKLFTGVDWDNVVAGARKAQADAAPQRRARGTAPKGDRVDYTAPDKFGQLHRGRITEEEAKLVKANREQANKNRQSQGHPAIDFSNDVEKKRYGL